MAETESKMPGGLDDDRDDDFEEAVEEAVPSQSEEKEELHSAMQTPRSSTPKPIDTGQQEKTQGNAEAGDKQAAEGAQEGTKPAHSASSSLQMTPTNMTFAENDESDEEQNKTDDTHSRQAEAGKSEPVAATEERAVEPAPEQSKEPISSEPAAKEGPQLNGHAKTPSVQEVPPTPISKEDTSTAPKQVHPAHEIHASEDSTSTKESATDAPPSSEQSNPDMDEEPPVQRLTRSAFSFFSRTGSIMQKGVKLPPPGQRRGTMSSIATTESTSTPSKQDDGERAKAPHRNSLKDRFKLLRMQEEAGIKWVGETETERPGSSHEGVDMKAMLPTTEEAEEEETDKTPISPRPRTTSAADVLGPAGKPTVNENLAPGTAAGTAAGPSSDSGQEVDWDLWQAVVYEGPAAVARTSPDELNEAIAGGIPSAIRGVVWQVLAQSQSTELEAIYKDLARKGDDSKPKADISSGMNKLSRTTSILRNKPSMLRRASSSRGRSASAKRESSTSREKLNGVIEEDQSGKKSPSKANKPAVSPGLPAQAGISSPPSPSEKEGEMITASEALQSSEANSVDGQSKTDEKVREEDEKRSKDEAATLQKLERAIRRDLGARTSYSKFLMSAGLQNGLFGICKAYALYDEEVGYAQGMNFIAMPLLFNMPEEEAFCLFVRLMNHYKLRNMFVHDMSGLHLHLYQFERLLEDFEPAVYCHLHRRGVHPQLYATQWFLTLFAYRFPLQLVLRIYDLILSEGLESAILKFGIVLMQKNAEKLLEMKDMAVLTTYLKERLFDVYIDKSPSASSVLESGFFGSAGGIDKEVYKADALVQDACAIKISSQTLKQYTSEWEEKTREEKQKQADEDTIRSQNQSLTLQVKTLEERSQKYDTEHVQIAQTLVHTQLENQKLSDDNESLKTQIAELRSIVSAQPGEIQEQMRAETERIMQRNIEVQNENRHLEEEVAGMESDLVQAKLKAAQLEEQLEDLKAKWVSVTQVMNAAGGSAKNSPRIT